jgi:hypothetical protein
LSRVRRALASGGLVLVLGAAALACARSYGAPAGLWWSDEITYALVARHLAEGRGGFSSFAHPDAVLARGLPLPDVHMPGHAYALALGFRLFGPTEAVAVAVGRLAFIAAGVLVSVLAGRVWGTAGGVWAAALFFFFPGLAAYGNTAMSETTLLLLAAAWWLVWREGLASGRPILAVALGLLLGVGATHRETFLALLPAGVYALATWPAARRRAAAAAATAVFAAWMAAVFWPLYRARAPYPHALSFLLDTAARAGVGEAVAQVLGRNASPWSQPGVWLVVYALEWACAAAAAAVAMRARGPARWLGTWGAATLVFTFVPLAPLYWLRGWTAVRMLLWTLPPGLAVIAGGWPGATVRRRHALPAALLAVFVGCGLAANRWQARDRREEAARGAAYAAFIRAHTREAPRVVIAAGAHRYGWEEDPVQVVDAEIDAGHLAALARRIPVDVVVSRRDAPHFLAVLREHGFARASATPFEGRHVYVRSPPPALDRSGPAR